MDRFVFAALLLAMSCAGATAPILYSDPSHESPTRGEPDDLLLLAGYGFAATDSVVYQALGDTTQPLTPPTYVPAVDTTLSGLAPQASAASVPYSLTVRLPATLQPGQAYALWVQNQAGEWSNGVRINDARPLWITPDYTYETAPVAGMPRVLKVVGRNLQAAAGAVTQVRLTGAGGTWTLSAADDGDPTTAVERYVALVTLPPSMAVGRYAIAVSRDGMSWVSVDGQTLAVLPDPTAAVEFPVGAYGCVADDGVDDTACIVSAVVAARRSGHGVVIFGPGEWDLANSAAPGVTYDGILVPVGVSLRGAGAGMTSVIRAAGWAASMPDFALQGNNTVQGITFGDANVYTPASGGTAAALQLGVRYYRAHSYSATDPTVTSNVVITGNVFDKTYVAIGDQGLPIDHLFVTYNDIGAYYSGLSPGGTSTNMTYPFRMDDSVIAFNTFAPGSYIDTAAAAGTIASQLGAGHRVDFSNNTADGSVTRYLYDPVNDPHGWRAGFFWHMNGSHEMVLISGNVATCTGDKDGDGEGIEYDNNHNTVGFAAAQAVLAATADSATVAGPLQGSQNGNPVPAGYYLGHWVQVAQGPGMGELRKIVSYTEPPGSPVTLTVTPAWDVIPSSDSKITVAREFWQMVAVDNVIDQRQPLCQKSNRTRPAGGVIGLWAQVGDAAVEGNRQYDTNGIQLLAQYRGAGTAFHSFIDVRGNTVAGEYDWGSACSYSGISIWQGAIADAGLPPPVAGYGVSIAHNTIASADGLHGGAIDLALSWQAGPPPSQWQLESDALIFHNTINDVSGAAPQQVSGCGSQGTRTAINLDNALTWHTVLYANSCSNTSIPVNDQANGTVRICMNATLGSCECPD
jgi:hypothetical protein